jgi:hypothetical protein
VIFGQWILDSLNSYDNIKTICHRSRTIFPDLLKSSKNKILSFELNAQNSKFLTHKFFMGRPGFEPETNRLKAECSTAELATRENIVTAHNF